MTRSFLIFWLGIACAIAAAAHEIGVRWNVSSSAAPGLYLERTRPLERGDLVAVCLPEQIGRWARGRGYLRRGRCPGGTVAIGKEVAAVEGDLVEVGESSVAVNGRRLEGSLRVDQDARGRLVPLFPEGVTVVDPGQVWLHSGRHGRSLDSRVYGPVEVTQIRGVLEPLWTAGEG